MLGNIKIYLNIYNYLPVPESGRVYWQNKDGENEVENTDKNI